MGISVMERAKAQAQVLVPLVKALQVELGEERANAIVRKTLGSVFRRLGEQWWQSKQSTHLGENMESALASWASLDFSHHLRTIAARCASVDDIFCGHCGSLRQQDAV